VIVHPRPRVGVLSTGSELVDFSDPLVGGKIRDTNRPMLLATLRRSGFTPVDLGSVKDDASAIAGKLQQGVQECRCGDSTGGVSVGDADFVKTVLLELCGEAARSMQVAIKPGKPFAFASPVRVRRQSSDSQAIPSRTSLASNCWYDRRYACSPGIRP